MKSSIFPTFGIAERLTLVATIVVVLSFVGVGGLFVNGLQNQMKERVESEGRDAILIAQKTLAQPMWTFDRAAIASTTQGLLQSNQGMIRKIRVYGSDGKILLEREGETQPGLESDQFLSDVTTSFEVKADIDFDGQKIGYVEFEISDRHLVSELKVLIEKVLLLMSAFIILVSVILFLYIQNFLAKPMSGLVELAEQIEAGNYEANDAKWPLEFGVISKAFARSSESIRRRDSQLRGYSEQLEIDVQERTRKIDEQRAAMVESSRLASLGEMSAGIAHEINNPLSIINGKIILMKRRMKSHPDFHEFDREFIKMESMVQRIAKIIEGLRTFSRDGSVDDKIDFDLAKVFTDIVDLCQARLQSNGVHLFIDLAEKSILVRGREVQISQVIINLVNNASDAIREQQERWVRIKVECKEEKVFISVSDSGPGIPIEIRKKMMQPFFTTKEVGKGTGLGLSISLGIISDHGGTLAYDENAPTTTFRIVLPSTKSITQAA